MKKSILLLGAFLCLCLTTANAQSNKSNNCFGADGLPNGRVLPDGTETANCSYDEEASRWQTCIDRDGSAIFNCTPKPQTNNRFEGLCHAGPISAMDTIFCYSESGLHVANGYVKALECAKSAAVSNCLLAGRKSCQFLTSVNLGWGSDPDHPGSHMGVCTVKAYVTGN